MLLDLRVEAQAHYTSTFIASLLHKRVSGVSQFRFEL